MKMTTVAFLEENYLLSAISVTDIERRLVRSCFLVTAPFVDSSQNYKTACHQGSQDDDKAGARPKIAGRRVGATVSESKPHKAPRIFRQNEKFNGQRPPTR